MMRRHALNRLALMLRCINWRGILIETSTLWVLAIMVFGCSGTASRNGRTCLMPSSNAEIECPLLISACHADGRALDGTTIELGTEIQLRISVGNKGSKSVFVRTDDGVGPAVDLEWQDLAGVTNEHIFPPDAASGSFRRAGSKYELLAGVEITGMKDGQFRDDQTTQFFRRVRIPKHVDGARCLSLTVSVIIEYMVVGSDIMHIHIFHQRYLLPIDSTRPASQRPAQCWPLAGGFRNTIATKRRNFWGA